MPPFNEFNVTGFSHHLLNSPAQIIQTGDGTQEAVFIAFKPEGLCKFIAKIAHGAAVALIGSDAFDPFLCDIIRNQDQNISTYVGSDTAKRWPHLSNLHRVQLFLESGYIIAKVQLFARFGCNPFIAVVGKPTDTSLDSVNRQA